MKPSLRRAAVLALLASTLTSACFGSFNLTRKVWTFNKTVSSDKFVQELVFLGFAILPVYDIAGAIDALVANTIEFWTGQNPISMSSTKLDNNTTLKSVTTEANGVRTMTVKAFRSDTMVSATTMQYVEGADRVTFKTVLLDGRKLTRVVARDGDGNLYVPTGNEAKY